jgi:DNA-binding transcriptional LysR family regulator
LFAAVVSVDLLEALDALLWLRTGHRAAEFLQCTQSTISRKSRRCLDIFQVETQRQAAEWQLIGDQELINLERLVHQQVRWQSGGTLRLDGQHWCSHLIDHSRLGPWAGGNFNYFNYERPLELLLHGVIDAWLTSAPDALAVVDVHPELAAQPITTQAMWPVVRPGHPLLAKGESINFEDLLDYPLLPLPAGAFPVYQAVLEQLALWPTPERNRRVRLADWQAQAPLEDMVIGLGNTLRLAAGVDHGRQPLPLPLPEPVGDVLVVRAEYLHHPQLLVLLQGLLDRAEHWAQRTPAWMEPMPALVVHRRPLNIPA